MLITAAIAAAVAFGITAPGAALLDRKRPHKRLERLSGPVAYTGPLFNVHGREVA